MLLIASLAVFASSSISARETASTRKMLQELNSEYSRHEAAAAQARRYTTTQVDTYCIAWFDFETADWQGWTQVDNTAQVDTFTHVDDFAGLGGGIYGGLVVREGTKSMWCGARPGTDEYMCSWTNAPGYGNDWNQMLVCDPFSFTGTLTFSYSGFFNSEPDYDFTRVEYDAGEGHWQEIAVYDGINDTIAVHELLLAQAQTKLRFHFTSDGAWSDQDGLWDTDGAFIVDSLTITDLTGTINYEDFEGANVTDKQAGIWRGDVEAPYGIYSGFANGLQDRDPCNENFTTQVVFFIGSPYPSSSHPGLFDTPFCLGAGGITAPCQNELIVSPILDLTKYSTGCDENQDADIPPAVLGNLGGAVMHNTVYGDMPPVNLSFYKWHIRNIDAAGCPGQWLDRGYVYYWSNPFYVQAFEDVSDLVTEDKVQVAYGIVDMCHVWYLVYGNCAQHSPAPWIDNVRFYLYETVGPQWSWRDADIFQDTFPVEEYDLESICRADIANDLNPNDDPLIRPGDSAVVDCVSPLAGGLATMGGGPAVFMHARVTHLGPDAKTIPSGAVLEGDYGTYYGIEGAWTVIQMDTAITAAGSTLGDKYMVDLSDSLFTRGMMIDYYFKAEDLDGHITTLPERAETEDQFFEFTCLPTLASDILFVDDVHGYGTLYGSVQDYHEQAFRAVLPAGNQPDRYDVNNPASGLSNGPGGRAKNFHMTTAYRKVIHDSGWRRYFTLTDGTAESDKANDCQLLIDWMNLSERDVGLLVMGDEVAWELSTLSSTAALDLMSNWCGVTLVHDSYYELTGGFIAGGTMTPLLHTVNNAFGNPMHPDSLYADGGCLVTNAFDVLGTTASSQYALKYPDFGGQQHYGAVQNERTNAADYTVRTMWFGFSFMYILDAALPGPGEGQVRNRIMEALVYWMGNETNDNITETETPTAYKLSQNFPNPFNPQTTISFSMREKGHVSLKIYNVAGQLVRTLVNEVKDAGRHRVTWDGKSNLGTHAASGVYFYKMETKNFSATHKMVMLR
jgi:hypothetical protein